MSWKMYDWLIAEASARAGATHFRRALLGLNWSVAETTAGGVGLCFSPIDIPRTVQWAGTLTTTPLRELLDWSRRWNPAEATVAQIAINALINAEAPALRDSEILHGDAPGNLRVFEHFRQRVQGSRVAVIGHYPGLEALWSDIDYECLERRLQAGDLPDTAADYILPRADWVFITASSIANKTLPRLLALSAHAQVVLMGPSLPWLHGWADFGVDYLAGVEVCDRERLFAVAGEGGGTRIFGGPVDYRLLAI